jgi:hypothetical protein
VYDGTAETVTGFHNRKGCWLFSAFRRIRICKATVSFVLPTRMLAACIRATPTSRLFRESLYFDFSLLFTRIQTSVKIW